MNTYKLIEMLEKYLEMLQQSSANDQDITDVKLMVWTIQKDIKIQRFINNLTVTNNYYRR
ncbi:hypothetical protein [Acinetobacter bereziniae]|uniref:hypothetical protein n=1 Tax=Acinetobacter bereziniae TaxID=106648 RepID=UPI0034CE54D9